MNQRAETADFNITKNPDCPISAVRIYVIRPRNKSQKSVFFCPFFLCISYSLRGQSPPSTGMKSKGASQLGIKKAAFFKKAAFLAIVNVPTANMRCIQV